MSVIAMKWFARQLVRDPTLTAVLRAVAGAADKTGCVSLRQEEIASRSMMTDRAVRSSLNLLEHFGVIVRQSRGAKKAGRVADVITLALDRDFTIPKEDVSDARRSGCTSGLYRNRRSGCTSEDCRNEVPTEGSAPSSSEVLSLYIARAHAFNFDAATVETLKEASARVWQEGDDWRARLTYQGLTLDLGRHECRDLAEAECRVRLLDIAHALRTKTGTPREPVKRPDLDDLNGEALMDFLVPGIRLGSAPQGKSEAKGTSTTASDLTASSDSAKQRQLPRARARARAGDGGAA